MVAGIPFPPPARTATRFARSEKLSLIVRRHSLEGDCRRLFVLPEELYVQVYSFHTAFALIVRRDWPHLSILV